MILSDYTIRSLLFEGDIEIEPFPKDICFQPASVDLTLGEEFKFQEDYGPIDNPEELRVKRGSFILAPQRTVLAHTAETVKVPDFLAARVEGRSSCGRKFLLIHSTAGFIDPGFKGQVTLEITNLSREDILLKSGAKICQVVFEELDKPAVRPYGHPELDSKYQNQTGAQPSLR